MPHYYYDWPKKETDDPKFKDKLPYGNRVRAVTIDGCNVTQLYITRVETGPNGTVTALVLGMYGASVEFPKGQLPVVVLKGDVRIEFNGE